MKLKEALDQIDKLCDEEVIFAQKPWTFESEAEICLFDKRFRIPKSVVARGLDYFLEVSVAKEVLAVFGERNPTAEERCALLKFYAENDAYPLWVYDVRTAGQL